MEIVQAFLRSWQSAVTLIFTAQKPSAPGRQAAHSQQQMFAPAAALVGLVPRSSSSSSSGCWWCSAVNGNSHLLWPHRICRHPDVVCGPLPAQAATGLTSQAVQHGTPFAAFSPYGSERKVVGAVGVVV